MVICNSFWGIDTPMPIPPNIVMTGSLTKRGVATQLSALERKDPSLYAWMNDAQSKGEDIIYLSLGSMCSWFEWSVKAMYNGVKDIPKTRVIWSINAEAAKFLPEDLDKSKFFISSWLPQVELLCHPSVKAGLTHCGWGGTLEFISSGIPMVCLPHFGDQPINSALIKDKGIGEVLIDTKHCSKGTPINFEKPIFTTEKVKELFSKVLSDPKYRRNIINV